MSTLEKIREYKHILRLLNIKPSMRMISGYCFLETIGPKIFRPLQMSKEMEIDRSTAYELCDRFERLGLLEKVVHPVIPLDWVDYSLARRRRWRKEHDMPAVGRIDIVVRYRYNPEGIIKTIDKRISELEDVRGTLEDIYTKRIAVDREQRASDSAIDAMEEE